MNNSAKEIKVALAGNPNCGKTTLFNALTGSNQYVGNWPGVTVEKKSGKVRKDNYIFDVIDLPGIYSLSPYTPEEIVTRNCLMKDNPDVIIDIVDATNIERNLYLTTQLAELGLPIVIALNMMDIVEKQGDKIDTQFFENKLGIPVIPISAGHNEGIDKLLDKVAVISEHKKIITVKNIYESKINAVLCDIEDALKDVSEYEKRFSRWTAVKLFEGDTVTWNSIKFTSDQKKHILFHINEIPTTEHVDREMIIADQRYKYICAICEKAVKKSRKEGALTFTDKVDRIVTNRFLALPLFLLIMLLVFVITFGDFGNMIRDGADYFINEVLANGIIYLIDICGGSQWVKSLLIDGVIAGVGSVISFLPQIVLLFLLLSILEDSGYMSRAAFIMDKLLRGIGLSGRAFVPMIMGFGCSVPAILGTRTLENQRDKRLTILIIPFMSCSAKMPVYLYFIPVFFPDCGAFVIFGIYILGMIVSVLTALLMKHTILKGNNAPFVMELPPYRMPSLKNLSLHVWQRVKDFLVRAGTILLGATIVIWFLQSFDFSFTMVSDSSESILASIGKFIAPIFTPCGFGDWRSAVSLVTGIMAKESVVSTMAVLYNNSLSAFSPASALSFMAFVLLYIPCIASISAIRKEMDSAKWTIFTITYQFFTAWIVSAIIYNICTFAEM